MDEMVKKQNDVVRITEWNDAGFTGKGIKVWDMESPTSDHGIKTHQRILDAAPDADVLNRGWSFKLSGSELEFERVWDPSAKEYVGLREFVDRKEFDILTASLGGGTNTTYKWLGPILRESQAKHKFLAFNSAGNDGDVLKGGLMPQDVAYYIAACVLYKGDPKDIRVSGYSSQGDEYEEVDFCTFVGPSAWNGTSFSTPYLAGTTALLLQRYGFMSKDEVYNYYKMIAKPLNVVPNAVRTDFVGGSYIYDFKAGYGIPILPKLDKRYLTIKINDPVIYLNGRSDGVMDTAPFIKDSRTFVPVAFIALHLGANVTWHPLTRRVVITKDNKQIDLYIDKKNFYINGKRYEMDTAPFIKDQRTFVPVSFIALALGCRVAWANDIRTVQILEMGE